MVPHQPDTALDAVASGTAPATPELALSEALRDFYVQSHRMMDRAMRAGGASFARTKLLTYLALNPGKRAADVAEMFGHAPRTTTEALDGLERDGLIRREPDAQDRRVKRLYISEKGIEATAVSMPTQRAFAERVFSALQPAELDVLTGLMIRLNARLAAIEQDAATAEGDRAGGGRAGASGAGTPPRLKSSR